MRKTAFVVNNILYELPFDKRFSHTRDMVSYIRASGCPDEYLNISDLDMRLLCYFIEYYGNFKTYRASYIARYFVENKIDPVAYQV
jgi:hypothetical protein